MAGNVVSNVKKYYGGQVPVPGQGDSDGKVKVLAKKTTTMEIEGVQTDVDLLYDADDLTTPVTPQKLGQWTDENYLIVFKAKDADGKVRGFILYALETEHTSTDTLVNNATFVALKGLETDPGASAFVFTMVEDSSTLTRYLRDENGEMVVRFNKSCVEAGEQSGYLSDLIGTNSSYMRFEIVRDEDHAYLNLSTGGLDNELEGINERLDVIEGILDELPSDEHGYFNSSLYTTPGDGTTTNLVIDNFRISEGRSVHGDNIEFVQTHQEGGVDFGEVYLNPGTYILNVHYTLQWVGNPRGTFLPLVANVGEQPFDFSYEHEDILRSTRIVTKTTRDKFGLNFLFDADTPPMGIWVKYLEIVQVASYNHPAVTHDSTLAGNGQTGDPLGVTPAAFGKVKDIPTSISQFRNGDVIPVDGPDGTAKMSKDDLLRVAAEKALADNVAEEFDPTRDEDHKYLSTERVVYSGKLKVFKVDHYGPWVDADAENAKGSALGVDDYEPVSFSVVDKKGDAVFEVPTEPTESIVGIFDSVVKASAVCDGTQKQIETLGFYKKGDNGGALYAVVSDDELVANGMNIIACRKEGLFLVLVTSEEISLEQLGGKVNDEYTDNGKILNQACSIGPKTIKLHKGVYWTNTVMEPTTGTSIIGVQGSAFNCKKSVGFRVEQRNLTFKNFSINYSGTGSASDPSCNAFRSQNYDDNNNKYMCVFENLSVNGWGTGFRLWGSIKWMIYWKSVRCNDCLVSAAWITQGFNLDFEGFYPNNCTLGVVLQGLIQAYFHGCNFGTIGGSAIASISESSNNVAFEDGLDQKQVIRCTGCNFETDANAESCDGAFYGAYHKNLSVDISIVNCWFTTNYLHDGAYGIVLNNNVTMTLQNTQMTYGDTEPALYLWNPNHHPMTVLGAVTFIGINPFVKSPYWGDLYKPSFLKTGEVCHCQTREDLLQNYSVPDGVFIYEDDTGKMLYSSENSLKEI